MKFICAPDSFKGSLTAVEAADAIASGVLSELPDASVDRCPVGDGGQGTLASLLEALNGQLTTVTVSDALGRPIPGAYGIFDRGDLTYVESASAIGLAAIPEKLRDVMTSSSFGVGELILKALESSPNQIIVGVGGSATNDGGCGMAQALGVRFYDTKGELISRPLSGGMLHSISGIDVGERATIEADVVVAYDVNNPLTGIDGAAEVYGPQKGADATQVAILDAGLRHLAEVIRRDCEIDVECEPGSGAAGGLAAGLLAFTDARFVRGVDAVLDAVNFASRIADMDLCLTGEGCLDGQSLSGKTCIGVAHAAAKAGVPVIALVGATGPGAELCLEAGIQSVVVIGKGLPASESIKHAKSLLTTAAANVARYYR